MLFPLFAGLSNAQSYLNSANTGDDDAFFISAQYTCSLVLAKEIYVKIHDFKRTENILNSFMLHCLFLVTE